MKRTTKAFIASLLLVGSTLTVGAQERISVRKQIHRQEQKSPRKDSGEKKHGMWSIKPQMGLTVATLTGDDAEGLESQTSWNGGIEVERKLNERIGLSVGLLYTNTGAKDKERITSVYVGGPRSVEESDKLQDTSIDFVNFDKTRYTLQYLSIPLMVNAYVVKGLALKVGVQPMFKVGGNSMFHKWGYYKAPHEPDSEYRHHDEENKKSIRKSLSTAVFAFPIGLSYEWKQVFVDARYHFSVGSAIKYSSVNNRYLSVNLGYRFQL